MSEQKNILPCSPSMVPPADIHDLPG